MGEMAMAAEGDRVASDIPCQHCGYNLRTLLPSGRCPECGRPVRDSLISWNASFLQDARWPVIRPLFWGALLFGMASLVITTLLLPPTVFAVWRGKTILVAAGMTMAVVGVVMASCAALPADPGHRGRWLRTRRVALVMLAISALCLLMTLPDRNLVTIVLTVVGLTSAILLFTRYLAVVAEAIPSRSLAIGGRIIAWTPFVGLFSLIFSRWGQPDLVFTLGYFCPACYALVFAVILRSRYLVRMKT